MPELSDHARARMASREITEDDIQMALNRRSGQPREGNNGTIVILGYARGGILKIVLTPDEQVIISVMWR